MLGLYPLALIFWLSAHARLGANPVQKVQFITGDWTIDFLMITLAVTPAAALLKQGWLKPLRRMLGLFAFFYGTLHFMVYLILDQEFDVAAIVKDTRKHTFILAGMACLASMTPLAITSTDGWIRRLGKRWGQLHRLVYASGVLAVIHYYWLVKKDHTGPIFYAIVLATLLGYRLLKR